MAPERLADVPATIATYTIDRLAFSLSPPVVVGVLDFDGGGRFRCELTDVDPATVAIGDRVEMTFRRLFTADGVHNYFWKAKPIASGDTEEATDMASHGIRDRVAIVGMGCTPFGEHWDKSADDLLVDAATEAFTTSGIKNGDVDAYWLGTMGSGISGLTLSRPLKIDYKPVTRLENMCATGSEAFRNACYAVASGAYRHRDGDRRREAEGLRLLRPHRLSAAERRHAARDDRARVVQPARARVRQEVRRRRGRDEGRADAHRVEEPQERRAQPTRAVPEGSVEGDDLQLAAHRRPARHLRLLGRERRLGCRAHRARRGRAQVHRQPDLREGAVVRRRPGGRPDRPDYDYTTFPEVVRSAADAYQQAGITDPRAELAMAEVHDCFTPTELVLMEDLGFAERGMGWKEVLAGTFDLDGELPVNPDGGLKSFGHPIGASGLRMLFECWLQLRGEAGERQISQRQDEGPDPQPRRRAGRVRELRERRRLRARLAQRRQRGVVQQAVRRQSAPAVCPRDS